FAKNFRAFFFIRQNDEPVLKKCQKLFQAQTGNLLEADSDRLFCKAERGKCRGQFHRVVGLSFFVWLLASRS
uniref:hypothetical protein n=1 Tax=Faecalibacterium prausnitzii TaxID=853 RepID=UPI004038A275